MQKLHRARSPSSQVGCTALHVQDRSLLENNHLGCAAGW